MKLLLGLVLVSVVAACGDDGGSADASDPTVTHTDGIGYIFNVNAGTVTVSASKAGSTFRSHPLNARADQVTTTLVQ